MGKTLIKMTPQLHNQWWSHQHGSSKLIWLSHMIGAWALIPTQCDLCLATSRPDEYMQMRKSAVNDAAALHFCRFVLHNGDSSTLIIITLKNMRFDVEKMEKMLMLKYQIIFLLPKNYIRLHTCGREVRENANYIIDCYWSAAKYYIMNKYTSFPLIFTFFLWLVPPTFFDWLQILYVVDIDDPVTFWNALKFYFSHMKEKKIKNKILNFKFVCVYFLFIHNHFFHMVFAQDTPRCLMFGIDVARWVCEHKDAVRW